jgi:hypothetical protein
MSKYEDRVINKIQQRATVGLSKYGVGVDREDINLEGWLNHLQEELMDAAIYVERLRDKLREDQVTTDDFMR